MASRTYSAKVGDIRRSWHLIDVSDKVLGRAASQIATLLKGKHKPIYTPSMDTGDHVIVINAAKIKVTGTKTTTKEYTRYSGYPGGLRRRTLGQAQEIDPTFPITNAVRGMLQNNTLGADMLKRLRVYAGPEHGHAAQAPKALRFDAKGEIQIG